MDRKQMKRLQAISHRVHKTQTDVATDFLSGLKAKLAERKYRADLLLVTAARDTRGTFSAEVKYNPQLGHPSENDLITLVAQGYPTHEINWELINVDPEAGIVTLMLEPSVEVVPVASMKEIPPEFTPIGSGIYKRAADASGNIHEIWELKKNPEGLALYRSNDDIEINAEEAEEFRSGMAVETPYGVGLIKRFDDLGNAFVQVGNKMHLIGQADMRPYNQDKEKTKLVDYYSQIYGPEFAQALVKEYDTQKKR